MLSVFRDLARFGYNHGLVVSLLILPYAAAIIALRLLAAALGEQEPSWHWLHFSALLALYPLYMGRVIRYLAMFAQPDGEVPEHLEVSAREWRRLFLVNLAVTFFVSAGLLVLILPGVYLAARFAFAEIVTVLRQRGPFLSLDTSWRETGEEAGLLFLGTMIIFGFFMPLQFLLASASDPSLYLRLLIGFTDELLSILQSLVATVFFFRVYCFRAKESPAP